MSGVITIVSWESMKRDTSHVGYLITSFNAFLRDEIRKIGYEGELIRVEMMHGATLYVATPDAPHFDLLRHELGTTQDLMADLACHDTDVDILWEKSPNTGMKWRRFENRRFTRPYPPQGEHVHVAE